MSPCWHLTYLKQCNILFVTKSHTYSSEQDQLLKELKSCSPHMKKTSTEPPLAQSPKDAPHTLNHIASFPLFSQTVLGDTQAWSFQSVYSQSNHQEWDSNITTREISYCLIESQPLPCTPTPCGHKFHVFTYHPHPTFTTLLFGSVFRIQLEVWWSSFVETVNVFRLLAVFAKELHHWCLATLS